MICGEKVYDTRNATKIADWDNEEFHHDAHFVEEMLYRAPCGTFFLRKIGGEFSENGTTERDEVYNCNRERKGDKLAVISDAEALQFLENHEDEFSFCLYVDNDFAKKLAKKLLKTSQFDFVEKREMTLRYNLA